MKDKTCVVCDEVVKKGQGCHERRKLVHKGVCRSLMKRYSWRYTGD